MANAGRVAIVPKGEYNSATAYKRLDLVRYNNAVYVAKKANTGVFPTNTDTWMLCIENVTQEQYDDIISGSVLVGNADKLHGLSIKTNGTRGIPIVNSDYGLIEIGNGIDFHTEEGQDYQIRLVVENGVLVLRDSTGASLVATHTNLAKYFPIDGSKSLNGKQFWVQDKVLLENSVNAVYLMNYDTAGDLTNGTGIRILTKNAAEDIKKRLQFCVKEDGTMSTFDILHSKNVSSYAIASTKVQTSADVNTMVNEGSFFVVNGINLPAGSSTHGFVEVKYYDGIGFAPNPSWGGTKCVRQIFYPYVKGTSNFVPQTRYGLLKTSLSTEWEWGEWSTDFIPLDGSVPMTGTQLLLYKKYGLIEAGTGRLNLYAYTVDESGTADNTNGRYLRIASKSFTDDTKYALQLVDKIDGAYTNYTVLHTGNSSKVVQSTSAPSDTSAVWVDTANKVTKIYKDGAWTALA